MKAKSLLILNFFLFFALESLAQARPLQPALLVPLSTKTKPKQPLTQIEFGIFLRKDISQQAKYFQIWAKPKTLDKLSITFESYLYPCGDLLSTSSGPIVQKKPLKLIPNKELAIHYPAMRVIIKGPAELLRHPKKLLSHFYLYRTDGAKFPLNLATFYQDSFIPKVNFSSFFNFGTFSSTKYTKHFDFEPPFDQPNQGILTISDNSIPPKKEKWKWKKLNGNKFMIQNLRGKTQTIEILYSEGESKTLNGQTFDADPYNFMYFQFGEEIFISALSSC